MVGDKIGADQNPFLTDIFQKIAVGCSPSCRGSLSTLIHTADRSNASHSGMTIGRDGSRVQSRSEFENRRHFVQAEDERTAEMWKEEMARECPLVGPFDLLDRHSSKERKLTGAPIEARSSIAKCLPVVASGR